MVTFQKPELVSRGGGLETWRVRWSSDQVSPAYTVWQNGVLSFDGTVTIEELLVTVQAGGQLLVDVHDDGLVPEPAFSGVVVVGWNAATNAREYRVEQWDGATWVLAATIPADDRGWFEYETDVLTDDTEHRFRVIAVGANDDEGVPCEWRVPLGRHPDVPAWTGSYDDGAMELTVA